MGAGGEADGKGEKIWRRLHAEGKARRRARSHDREIMTWDETESQMLNWLNCPGAPG